MAKRNRLSDGQIGEIFRIFAEVMDRGRQGLIKASVIKAVLVELLATTAAGSELRDGEILVPVETYEVPELAELRQQFDWVLEFHGSSDWQDHKSCQDISREPGDRAMLLKHFARDISSDDVITWAEENGYRPATRADAIAYAKANPDEQRKFPIVALGSFVEVGGDRIVTVLSNSTRLLSLDGSNFGGGCPSYCRFLLVRK